MTETPQDTGPGEDKPDDTATRGPDDPLTGATGATGSDNPSQTGPAATEEGQTPNDAPQTNA